MALVWFQEPLLLVLLRDDDLLHLSEEDGKNILFGLKQKKRILFILFYLVQLKLRMMLKMMRWRRWLPSLGKFVIEMTKITRNNYLYSLSTRHIEVHATRRNEKITRAQRTTRLSNGQQRIYLNRKEKKDKF